MNFHQRYFRPVRLSSPLVIASPVVNGLFMQGTKRRDILLYRQERTADSCWSLGTVDPKFSDSEYGYYYHQTDHMIAKEYGRSLKILVGIYFSQKGIDHRCIVHEDLTLTTC